MATPKKKDAKKGSPSKAAPAKDKSKSTGAKVAMKSKPSPSKPAVAAAKPKTSAKPAPAPPARPAIAYAAPADIFTKKNAPKSAGRTEVVKPIISTPGKPAKPVVDEEWQRQVREMMVNQRHQLLSVVQSTQAQMAEKSGDLPDVSDRASEGVEDELAVGLMAIEAAQLDDIDYAIARIDDGTYGLCVDCNKPIPRKRLEVLPFARRCLPCEGQKERRPKSEEAAEDEEEVD